MTQEKIANSTEAPESMESEQAEPFVSRAQKVGDEISETQAPQEASEKTSLKKGDGNTESLETSDDDISDAEIDSMIEEISNDASPEDVQEAEESVKEAVKKDNTQKRIDELTAKAKENEEKFQAALKQLDELKSKVSEPKQEQAKRLSDAELAEAIKDFMDEGDAQGILNIINYKQKLLAEDLRNQYMAEQRHQIEAQTKKAKEWETIIHDFSPKGYKEDLLKNDPDFDITKNTSRLYKLADELYRSDTAKYGVDGGMRQATRDAFQALILELISKKKSKTTTKEMEGLKNRLSKEQRKKSVGDGASEPSGDKAIPTPKDDLDDALKERRSYKAKRMSNMI